MDQTNDTVLFSGRAHVNGIAMTADITASGKVRWRDGGGGRWRLEVEKEIIGISKDGCYKVIVHAVLERGEEIIIRSGGITTVRKSFVFEVEDEEFGRGLCENIQRCIDSLVRDLGHATECGVKVSVASREFYAETLTVAAVGPTTRVPVLQLFVLVNPFGGSKCASKIFLDDVKPLLEDANVEYTLQETKHRLHAKEVALSLDLSKYDGIVCVSGDGTLVEVVNGLLERADWENAIKTALGVVPAGTGNGMAKSLLDSFGLPCTAFHATLAIIRGHKRCLDVTTVLQGETKFFSVLMLAWGLVADIDIESEKYRWMGKARFDVYGLQRVLSLRKYNGCISFVPASGFEGIGEPSDRKDEPLCKKDEIQQCGYLGPDIDLGSSKWRKMNGPFVSVWLHNVPWGAEETKAAPDAKFSDGYLDLILIRDCPKFSLLTLMTELSNGNHVKSPHVSYLKVKAFVLEPGSRTDDPTKGGIIDVDGEVLARGKGTYKAEQKALMKYDKLQLIVDHGLATIFTHI